MLTSVCGTGAPSYKLDQRLHGLRHRAGDFGIHLLQKRVSSASLGGKTLPAGVPVGRAQHQKQQAGRRQNPAPGHVADGRTPGRVPGRCGLGGAPIVHPAAELRHRAFHAIQTRPAFFALTRMALESPPALTSEPAGNVFRREMFVHWLSPIRFRTASSARNRCAFTVPSRRPVTAAISSKSRSSTKRSRKTVRWRSDRVSTTLQIAATRSLARSEEHTSELQSASDRLTRSKSGAAARVRRQKRSRRLRMESRTRLTAICISQVFRLASPRNL